jgi:hypothetical protein
MFMKARGKKATDQPVQITSQRRVNVALDWPEYDTALFVKQDAPVQIRHPRPL